MKKQSILSKKNLFLLSLLFGSNLLLSPKWMVGIAYWILFLVSLRFYRNNNWKGFIISIPVWTFSAIIAQYQVFPMDAVSLGITMVIANTIGLLPFIIDRYFYSKLPPFLSTLLFPSCFTLFSYFMDQGPQGTWSNSAYTQFHFTTFIQVASLTGIYGINFLVTWFAAFANHVWETRNKLEGVSKPSLMMPVVFLGVLIYGNQRLDTKTNEKEVTVAAITMDNKSLFQSVYRVAYGEEINIPVELSQSSPLAAKINQALGQFMENPSAQKNKEIYQAMDQVFEKYVKATRQAANEGAKIITWSEAAIVNIKSRDDIYTERAALLAKELNVYLFFPTAVFHPEKFGKEPLFIENKVLAFDPSGVLQNTYFKNIPVMGVEPSFPGDGTIPVIESSFGKLSPVICYDADHPQLMAQTSSIETDLLVVPTGDWKAISPYHTYMAAIRCIENGVSMLKSTSRGLSAMVDDKGRILNSYDFFDEKEIKMMVGKMPIKNSTTWYAVSAPAFIGGLGIVFLLCLLMVTIHTIKSKVKMKNPGRLSPINS